MTGLESNHVYLKTLPAIALLLSCSVVAPAQSASETFLKVADEAYEDILRLSPERAAMAGRHEHSGRWSDLSATGLQQRTQTLWRYLEVFRSTPAAQLVIPQLEVQIADEPSLRAVCTLSEARKLAT